MSEVGNLPEVFVDQLTSLPDGISSPGMAVSAVAAGIAAAYMEDRVSRSNEEKFAAPFQNPAALEVAMKSVRGNTSRRQRLAPALGMTLGAGLAAAGMVGGFSYDTERSDNDARAVVINDASYTMRHTKDLGDNTSRYSAVVKGLKSSKYDGRIAVVESGNNHRVRMPMEPWGQQDFTVLGKPVVDPNGGELASSIEDALSLLPNKKASKDNSSTKQGTIVVMSDGTISSSSTEMANASKRAEKRGITLKAVVPGTSEGTYSLNGSDPIESGVRTDTFDSLGSKNVEQASNKKEIEKAIENAMKEAGTIREPSEWYVPLGLGLGLIAVSGAAFAVQRIRKIA